MYLYLLMWLDDENNNVMIIGGCKPGLVYHFYNAIV